MPGLLFRLAIPTMPAQFVNVLYSIVDRMFIGHIAGIGSLALAGVGVCGPIITLLSSFSLLVGLGGTPLMAMKLGAGDREAACLFALVSLRLPGLPVPLCRRRFRIALCRRILALGLPPFLTYALDSVILIILNTVLQRRSGPGEGDILITCSAVVQSYMLLISMPMSGITLGCQGVVSFNLGAGDGKRVRQALGGVFLLCFVFAVLMLAFTQIFSPQFVRFFSKDGEILSRSVRYTKIYTAGVLFMSAQWTCVDMATALGQVRLALCCSLIRKSILLAGILLFPVLFAASAVFAAEPFCDISASLLSAALFLRFTPGGVAEYCSRPNLRDEKTQRKKGGWLRYSLSGDAGQTGRLRRPRRYSAVIKYSDAFRVC